MPFFIGIALNLQTNTGRILIFTVLSIPTQEQAVFLFCLLLCLLVAFSIFLHQVFFVVVKIIPGYFIFFSYSCEWYFLYFLAVVCIGESQLTLMYLSDILPACCTLISSHLLCIPQFQGHVIISKNDEDFVLFFLVLYIFVLFNYVCQYRQNIVK